MTTTAEDIQASRLRALPGARPNDLQTTREAWVGRLRPGTAGLLRMAVGPVVTIGMLALACLLFGVPFGQQYVILSLLVFFMTFPGSGTAPAVPDPLRHRVVMRWLATVGLLLLLGFVTQTLNAFDPRVIATWAVMTPFALVAAHRYTPTLFARLLSIGGAHSTAVIVGATQIGLRLAERIAADPSLAIRVAGFFDDGAPNRAGGLRESLLGSLGQLAAYVKSHRVDVIYMALPMCPEPRISKVLDELRDTTASVYFVPDVLMFDLIQARVDTIGGVPVIAVCESPIYGINAVIKRASDIILATLILVITAPVLAVVALGVKLSSPGPVLFRQRRYGLDGREIIVYKFRTMTCLEDGEVIRQAKRNDDRTTRFGAFLRRYSLDELPQFVNVLQGRMSVVGPRPHAICHNELYRKLISGYMLRHKVKPGITGLAQVSGLRGETDTVDKMQARIECDLEYLRKWSIWLDLKIVARSVRVVIDGEGAW